MKKYKLLFAVVAALLIIQQTNAQVVNWSEQAFEYKTKKAQLKYIGTRNETYYFYYLLPSFARFNVNYAHIIAVKNGTTLHSTEELKITDTISKIYLEDGKIKILFSGYNKDAEVFEVFLQTISTQTLSVEKTKTILSFESSKKNENFIYYTQSPDSSKIMIAYMDVDSKTKKGFVDISVFDNSFQKIWTKKYVPEFEGEITIGTFSLSNDGELNMLGLACLYNNEAVVSRNFFVSTMSEDDLFENKLGYPEGVLLKSLSSYMLDNNRILIAGLFNYSLIVLLYDIENNQLEKQISVPLDNYLFWQINSIKMLANGRLVIICEDAYTKFVSSKSTYNYYYYNQNLRIVCLDQESLQPVYNQLISRSTFSKSDFYFSVWGLESPSYFISGNNFYALYNTSAKTNDLSKTPVTESETYLSHKNSDIVTNMIKIDEVGNCILFPILKQNEDEAMYTSLVNIQTFQNEAIIAKISQNKLITIGTIELK